MVSYVCVWFTCNGSEIGKYGFNYDILDNCTQPLFISTLYLPL